MNKQPDPFYRLQKTLKNLRLLFSPIEELYYGAISNTIPWHQCAGWMIVTTIVLVFKIDQIIISHTRFYNLYANLMISWHLRIIC